MYSTSKAKQGKVIDLQVMRHLFTLDEHSIAEKAIKSYTPSIWAPINVGLYSPDIQNERRQFYWDVLNLFVKYTPEWVLATEEKLFLEDALNHFIHLPLPLYGSFHEIIERKRERKVAKRILKCLE